MLAVRSALPYFYVCRCLRYCPGVPVGQACSLRWLDPTTATNFVVEGACVEILSENVAMFRGRHSLLSSVIYRYVNTKIGSGAVFRMLTRLDPLIQK